MSETRVVIDTNVVVSAVLLPRSVPRQAFDAAVSLGKLLVSEVCRDADDDKFLELAVSRKASHIVSGDDDMLALHSAGSPFSLHRTSWPTRPEGSADSLTPGPLMKD
jgi:predicted nucleic acid-binding protein